MYELRFGMRWVLRIRLWRICSMPSQTKQWTKIVFHGLVAVNVGSIRYPTHGGFRPHASLSLTVGWNYETICVDGSPAGRNA